VLRTTHATRSPTRIVYATVTLVVPSRSVTASTSTVSPQRADDDHSSELALTTGSQRAATSSQGSPWDAHQWLDVSSAQVR